MINKILGLLKKRELSPRVYSILLKHKKDGNQILWTVAAYSLEEALGKSKKQAEAHFASNGGGINPSEYKMELFNWEDPAELFEDVMRKERDSSVNVEVVELGGADKDKLVKSLIESLKGSGLNPINLGGSKPDIGEIFKPNFEGLNNKRLKVKPEKEDKNKERSVLMAKIIEEKDLKLLEENRTLFKPAEIKFMEDKLKIKGK